MDTARPLGDANLALKKLLRSPGLATQISSPLSERRNCVTSRRLDELSAVFGAAVERKPTRSLYAVSWRRLLALETHQENFTWVFARLAEDGLVRGETLGSRNLPQTAAHLHGSIQPEPDDAQTLRSGTQATLLPGARSRLGRSAHHWGSDGSSLADCSNITAIHQRRAPPSPHLLQVNVALRETTLSPRAAQLVASAQTSSVPPSSRGATIHAPQGAGTRATGEGCHCVSLTSRNAERLAVA